MMLGMHPEIQEKVYEESIETLGPDRPIEHTDLPNLKYIERCIYEVLRLFPITPIVSRYVDETIQIGM